jgi:protein TonB
MPYAEFPGASPNAHFLAGDARVPHAFQARWWEGTGVSIAAHAILFGILAYGATHVRQVAQIATTASPSSWPIFLAKVGVPGGGGGGGEWTAERPRKAQLVSTSQRAIQPTPNPADIHLKPEIHVPIQSAQAIETLPGALTPIEGISPGKGTGPGGGGLRGPGSGPDDGAGVGAGHIEGMGGAFPSGTAGVTSPQLIKEVKPRYTVDAMRAKVQGVVEMQGVVLPDGSVDPKSIRITRSLDRVLGLDQQAVAALSEWRFRPGTFKGQPVSVRINVELTFTLR